MRIVKALFGGRIEGKAKKIMEAPKKTVIGEGKRIGATVLSLVIVGVLGWRGYEMPEEAVTEIAMAVVAGMAALLTAWSKLTKK